jgi:hypothetical protein
LGEASLWASRLEMNAWHGGERDQASEWVQGRGRKTPVTKAAKSEEGFLARLGMTGLQDADMGSSGAGPLRGEMQDARTFDYAQGKLKAGRHDPKNRPFGYAQASAEGRPLQN